LSQNPDHDYSDNNAVPEINGEWTVITSKNHVSKSGKHIQSVIDNPDQFTKPSNCYLPLTTMSIDNEGTIPVIVNRKITAKGSDKVNSGAAGVPNRGPTWPPAASTTGGVFQWVFQ